MHRAGEQRLRLAPAQGPTCSSRIAVVPAPSAGCSRRVSCESRKGTCGLRARSAAITPPRASKERLIAWASRRRRAPFGSLWGVLATPAFHTRSDPARSTRCSVPTGANEPAWKETSSELETQQDLRTTSGTCDTLDTRWRRST